MMDFMDSLRRGVDKAGFEMDRLLRANRVRSQINALRSHKDEEVRQIGRQVVEMCLLGEAVPAGLEDRCLKVRQFDDEIAAQEAELEAINQEAPAAAESAEPSASAAPAATVAATAPKEQAPQPPLEKRCHSCGAGVPDAASFCPNCGAEMATSITTPNPEAQAGEEPAEPGPPHSPTV